MAMSRGWAAELADRTDRAARRVRVAADDPALVGCWLPEEEVPRAGEVVGSLDPACPHGPGDDNLLGGWRGADGDGPVGAEEVMTDRVDLVAAALATVPACFCCGLPAESRVFHGTIEAGWFCGPCANVVMLRLGGRVPGKGSA